MVNLAILFNHVIHVYLLMQILHIQRNLIINYLINLNFFFLLNLCEIILFV